MILGGNGAQQNSNDDVRFRTRARPLDASNSTVYGKWQIPAGTVYVRKQMLGHALE